MRSKKETAWKKSRTFGDVKGGRKALKWYNSILHRMHNLEAPAKGTETPVYIQDNPSRDFYHPVSPEEIKAFLSTFHEFQAQEISYIWLRKQSHKEYEKEDSLQGCYIWGENVRLIVLYSFPKDNKMSFGKRKPTAKILRWYQEYCTDLREEKDNWYLQWNEKDIKEYYLNGLLLHEIGHHVDKVYKYGQASQAKAEKWADAYSFYWANRLRERV
ncbi:MAG: hypothetical protein AAFV95_03745 [Bacteroidota bacterium]